MKNAGERGHSQEQKKQNATEEPIENVLFGTGKPNGSLEQYQLIHV